MLRHLQNEAGAAAGDVQRVQDLGQALVELHAGDTAAAIDAAEHAIDAGYPVAVLAAEPILAGLWDDSRFVALMARHSVGGQQK